MTIRKNRCECGNILDPAVDGPDALKCEWCEYPEPPMYKIHEVQGFTMLFFIDGGKWNTMRFGNDEVAAYAPSIEAAKAIFEDYMANHGEGAGNVCGCDQN